MPGRSRGRPQERPSRARRPPQSTPALTHPRRATTAGPSYRRHLYRELQTPLHRSRATPRRPLPAALSFHTQPRSPESGADPSPRPCHSAVSVEGGDQRPATVYPQYFSVRPAAGAPAGRTLPALRRGQGVRGDGSCAVPSPSPGTLRIPPRSQPPHACSERKRRPDALTTHDAPPRCPVTTPTQPPRPYSER